MSKHLSAIINSVVEIECQNLFESFRGFDFNKMKQMKDSNEMIIYAEKHLPYLGEGSSRIVFGWKAGKVIKIQPPKDNVRQNEAEIKIWLNKPNLHPLISKIYDYDDENYNWIVAEGVQVISDNAHLKVKFSALNSSLLFNLVIEAREHSTFEATMSALKDLHHTTKLEFNSMELELLEKLHKATRLGIFDIGRLDHWGVTTLGRIVIVDYGID